MQEEEVPPSVDLLESMRSVGYSLNAAVADLVDNSISASAQTIDIDLEPTAANHIAILDDGIGMSPEKAVEALRLAGSVSPRTKSDLGKFGLGLKTASLSQGRRLTVVTKRMGEVTALRWDIDHIRSTGKWSLLRLSPDEINSLPWVSRLLSKKNGTLVLWENLDLLLGDTTDAGETIRDQVSPLIDSLALIFHRYLNRKQERIHITVNGNVVEPHDPFLTANTRTQVTPTQHISIGGQEVGVTAYTLPHLSGLTPKERQRPDLSVRMRESQGFYIYRNERLISHGHWYGLARMDEISKQTRVRVDVPNTIDHLWQLDIKKSRAEPPASFKAELRRVMSGVLDKGKRIYTYRGRKENSAEVVHFWNKLRHRDGIRYEVNLEHPLVLSVLSEIESRSAARVSRLFESIATSFPTDDLFAEMAGNVRVVAPTQDEASLIDNLRVLRDSGIRNSQGKELSADSIASMLAHTEPFNKNLNLKEIVNQVWKEESNSVD